MTSRMNQREYRSVLSHLLIERGEICELCRKRLYDHLHHVNGDPKDNRHGNLRLLCARCHKQIHKSEVEFIDTTPLEVDYVVRCLTKHEDCSAIYRDVKTNRMLPCKCKCHKP